MDSSMTLITLKWKAAKYVCDLSRCLSALKKATKTQSQFLFHAASQAP